MTSLAEVITLNPSSGSYLIYFPNVWLPPQGQIQKDHRAGVTFRGRHDVTGAGLKHQPVDWLLVDVGDVAVGERLAVFAEVLLWRSITSEGLSVNCKNSIAFNRCISKLMLPARSTGLSN